MQKVAATLLRAVIVYLIQAIAFALVSYLIMHVAYGGVRISLLTWSVIVVVVFTLLGTPHFMRARKIAQETLAIESSRRSGDP